MRRIYLAGPMTGIKDFNYPAFNAAAKLLRENGYHVENPAENSAPDCGTWLGYMRIAITQLATCDMVVMLPGWSESRGAVVERNLAKGLGLQVIDLSHLTQQLAKQN